VTAAEREKLTCHTITRSENRTFLMSDTLTWAVAGTLK